MRARGTWLVFFLVTGAVAEENGSPPKKPTPPAASASTDESIAAAKREFGALKSARSSLLEKGELPQVKSPELTLTPTPSAVPTAPKLRGAKATSARTANWLLDAMLKPKLDTADLTGKSLDRSQTKDSGEGATDRESVAGRVAETAHASASERSPRVEPTTPNPLSSYMAGWMSPADFTLLRPVIEAEANRPSAGLGAEPGKVERFENNDLHLSIEGFGFDRSASATSTGPRGPGAENPYMKEFEFLKAEPPAAVAALSSAFNSSPALPVESGSTTKPIDSLSPGPGVAVPDFAKRSDDAKYFRQLKRF